MPEYEQEQAELRRKYSGEDIKIDPPSEAQVNPELLKDVEPMLFRGFLHVSAEINGVPFVFKSLNHHEFDMLRLMLDPSDKRGSRSFYDFFLAYGVFMIDGVNILPERDQYIPEIASMFRSMDEPVRRKVIRYMSEINRRASRAVVLTEVYCMEPMSRLRWSQYYKIDLTSPAVTGISGTQHLGMHWGQLAWRAVNYYEDQRESAEREWENAKFIAGAFAGSKGLSSVNSQDKQRREREKNEKIDRRDKILRSVVLGEDIESKTPHKGAPMKVARTVEELSDQLEKNLRGEQDWHDKVVAEHERKAREQYEARMHKLQELRESHITKYGDRPVIGGTEVIEGLTSEEVRKRIEDRKKNIANRLASARAYPEVYDSRLAQVKQKWLGLPKDGK